LFTLTTNRLTRGKSCCLCQSTDLSPYFSNKGGKYLKCNECDLVFVTNDYHLSIDQEKSRYDLHQNNPQDQNYRAFLSKLADPVLGYLKPNSNGLDFGCGPGPTLSLLFEEKEHQVTLFDKFYVNNPSVFNTQYDFITATEVVEHLENPGNELARLFSMLNKDGVLAVMTQLLHKDIDFSSWYYKDDPTHICFFSKKTFEYLAKKYQARLEVIGDNVVLLFPN